MPTYRLCKKTPLVLSPAACSKEYLELCCLLVHHSEQGLDVDARQGMILCRYRMRFFLLVFVGRPGLTLLVSLLETSLIASIMNVGHYLYILCIHTLAFHSIQLLNMMCH